MKFVFYITNHGYGHASRNVPIIEELLQRNESLTIDIKSDIERCVFLKKNLEKYSNRIKYYTDCSEVGLILKSGNMIPDTDKMKNAILQDFLSWEDNIIREKKYMLEYSVNLVICDVLNWPIRAAKELGISSVLIGNFTWSQMYQSFYGEEIWKPYVDNYKMADLALWYEIHDKCLDDYCENTKMISLVSRRVNPECVDEIREKYNKRPIVFMSNGASAELDEAIDVNDLPYEFLITRGLNIIGNNVHELPFDMTNTPDYIAAADYIIAKGGWSTMAEILLQKKKCALIFRGNNAEDDNTRKILEKRQHCVGIQGRELKYISHIIRKIDELEPESYDIYRNDTGYICDLLMDIIRGE